MRLLPTCKEAAALLIANEDCLISLGDQAKVRLHMLACNTCPNFERQLLMMRNAMKQWRNYAPDDAAERR